MRTISGVLTIALILVACVGGTEPGSTTVTATSSASTTRSAGPTTTSSAGLSTTSSEGGSTTSTSPAPNAGDLPGDGGCSLDAVPEGGEATVVYEGRLYGLGPRAATPRCLADGVTTLDVEWGPLGDRLRIGPEVLYAESVFEVQGAASLEWTAPTGSRILAVSMDRVWKVDVDGQAETDITFLKESEAVSYHPAGTHVLAIGTDFSGQNGLWLATNQGSDPLLIAFDEAATLSSPVWSWLGEPLFVASHLDGLWHVHRVELTAEGSFGGPVVVESDRAIDRLTPARYDPVMLAYRLGGQAGVDCVEGARTFVNGVDLPEPLSMWTSTPVGWLSAKRLLVLAYPDGCQAPGDLWSFSAGFCPGSVYGASLLITGVDGAAAREAAPPAPPSPAFTGVIDPAPA